MPVILTGKYPDPAKSIPTLMGLLKEVGYKNAVISTKQFPWGSGLTAMLDLRDLADLYLKINLDMMKAVDDKILLRITKNDFANAKTRSPEYRITDKAIQWIQKQKKAPFFLWLHYLSVHEWRRLAHNKDYLHHKTALSLYKRSLSLWDLELARLLKYLKESGRLKNTIIVITGDHGEALGEHGYFMHSFYLYNVLTHVPLAIYVPGVPPRQVSTVVGQIDLTPTLWSLIGGNNSNTFQGCDDRALFFREDKFVHRLLMMMSLYQFRLMDFPFVLDFYPQTNFFKLYNIENDPQETKNLYWLPGFRRTTTRLFGMMLWFLKHQHMKF